MAPFRPSNLNKRLYPGNANVIGPTTRATVGLSTTTCCSSTKVCGACSGPDNVLGCRFTYCSCPCCTVCCSCPCTVCTASTPSGMWKSSEQYNAAVSGAWGTGITSSAGSATCLCCTGVGSTDFSAACVDCKGFFLCCGPSTNKWFVAPSCTEVRRSWDNRADSVTVSNSCMGSCGWFVPTVSQLQNPGSTCKAYWDTCSAGAFYWSNTESSGNDGFAVRVSTNFTTNIFKGNTYSVRAFRCTAS